MVNTDTNNKRSVCFKYGTTACSSARNGTAACTTSNEDQDDTDQNQGGGFLMIKEQDRFLPIANVGRIMKQILPPNAKISKEGKETMQECVSEFISFVTGEASDKCLKEKRKTINGDDICWALGSLGFDDYSESLKRYLNKYREAEGERANQNNGKGSMSTAEEEEEQRAGGGASNSSEFTFNLIKRRKG